MNIDLDRLLGSTESTFTLRERPSRVVGKKCSECDDGVISECTVRLCRICGEILTDIFDVETAAQSAGSSSGGDVMNFFDLLGDDVRAAIQESMAQSQPDRQISTEYLSKLGKVVLDCRRGLLHDIVLSFGMLSIMGTLATFGPIPQKELAAHLVFGDPEYGENLIFSNSLMCTGAAVLLRRGKVSFAKKALSAQSSGAAALIVCQSFDVWPFVMTDSANELLGIELNIPIIMISQADSLLLEKILTLSDERGQIKNKHRNSDKSNEKVPNSIGSSPASMLCKLSCGGFEDECSICQEKMLEGNTILKLTCRHAYHAECVQIWLERHNTCPLCRNEMPRHVGPKKGPSRTNETTLDMPYFN